MSLVFPTDRRLADLIEQLDILLLNQVGCLNLLINAIIIWNTVYINQVVLQLRTDGYEITDADLQSICPTRQKHLNVYGTYLYEAERIGQTLDLRPLHRPRSQP